MRRTLFIGGMLGLVLAAGVLADSSMLQARYRALSVPAASVDVSGLRTGLIAYWPLDESSSVHTNHAGSSFSLTNAGATYVASGKLSGAYRFNGGAGADTGHLRTGNINVTNTTFAAWVYRTNAWSELTMVMSAGHRSGASSDPFIGRWDWGKLGFGCYAEYVYRYAAAPSDLNLNQWYFLAGTFDSTNIRFYVDGDLVATTARSLPIPMVDSEFVVGATRWGTCFDFCWSGYIDEPAVWSRALPPNEISQLYNAGSGVSLRTVQ